jgi:pimeloyl-ACP methyl ester carboxylesterase
VDHSIGDVSLHCAEYGNGAALVALHGAGVDHREVEAAVEPFVRDQGCRRIYLDLPGMGRSTSGGLAANDDVVTLLAGFIEQLDSGPVLLLGHSYGGYLARGVAARHPNLVRGLALICPVADAARDVPEHHVVVEDEAAYHHLDSAQRNGFDEYFVIRTPATARRYRDHVWPSRSLVDETALERIFARWTIDLGSAAFDAPSLIVAGRRDSVVGYSDALDLVDQYPRAAVAIVEDAGHALLHERPELLGALIRDWLVRTRPA